MLERTQKGNSIVGFPVWGIVLASLLGVGCGPKAQNYSILSALEQMLVGGGGSGSSSGGILNLPFFGKSQFLPGQSVNLNGNSSTVVSAIVVDPSGNGSAVGLSTQGNGIPNLLFLYQGNSVNPYAVDVNGDGVPDYYLCYHSDGSVTLTTGTNCSGNAVTIYPNQGFDTNGDGVVDNPIIARLLTDTIAPSSSISPTSGTYGGVQTVTIVCADNVAPGNLAYTSDGTSPTFVPVNGTITNPPKTTTTIGGNGDGSYTIKYRCRDMAGNLEGVNTASYQVNHNVPNVTIVTPVSSFYISVNAGAVNTASYVWKSSQTGSYSVRQNATGCSDGTVIESGIASANQNNTSFISASQLSLGSNSIYICVSSGFTGQNSFAITRDDTPPTVTASPGAGGYGYDGVTPISVQLNFQDNSGVTSGYQVAYTTDGSNPGINSLTGAITNGFSYPPANASAISLTNNTTLNFTARDPAGNLSTVGTAIYVIDSSRPTIQINSFAPTNKVLNATSNLGINWQFSGNGASYKVLLGGNQCTASTTSTTTNGNTTTKTTYAGPSGTKYTNSVDCECNNGAAPSGTSSFVSGNVVTVAPTGSDIVVNTPVNTTLANLNFTAGKNNVIICVANQKNQPEYGMQTGSQSIPVWKDTMAPKLVSATPSGGATGVNPNSAQLTLVFSEPLDPSHLPNLTVQVFQLSSWVSLDLTNVKYQFLGSVNQPDTLVIQFPWIFFPENALIQWSIASGSLVDAAGLALASTITQSFLTTTFETANGFAFKVLKTDAGDDTSISTSVAQQLSTTPPNGLWTNQFSGTNLVVFDFNTYLVWKQTDEGVSKDYITALNQCSGLNVSNGGLGYASLTNWRLPSVQELASISIYSNTSPSIASASFSGTASAPYWSSTLFAPTVTNAWYVDFQYPDIYFDAIGATHIVRCVSGVPGSSPTVP
ncbi:PF07603 family protein [Leptospira fainei serovar Hurstbridge str. BUT 6]|uniref:PF07603 family protein n=1 Tax=Leptospira fainei serovar Hurstbridge str. BUT 6 TaxID=1193011 RepID=S3VB13_9LEPT|nr:DUF1566 domain-containing protein [Leptospira fainei]EPG73650.1 PF07603 family protein [Leptospira fainei serovar Hurstbridge str. BUT 6]